MADNPADLRSSDLRRAAALVAHFGRDDAAGVSAVLTEASEDHRPVSLILAVLHLYNMLVPELRTEMAMSFMQDAILKLAAEESAAGGDA